MLPGSLAPLDGHKTRALTTIYAPRKLKPRKNKTAQSRMLENDISIKPSLSPFHPLPAIGQNAEKRKVIVFDLKNSNTIKLQEVLHPLSPLNVHGLRKTTIKSLEDKPQQLLRENTYDVIEPIYINATKVKKKDAQKMNKNVPMSPKTRFKNAALQVAKLNSTTENGKLLCLRERETYTICRGDDPCRLQRLSQSPVKQFNKLTEIFQNLEVNGRHRDRIKKENSWF